MFWFNRQKKTDQLNRLERADRAAVEIVTHKDANKKLVKEAKAANDQLQNLLIKNGFTVKIYIAAGGKTKTNRTRKAT